MNINNNNYSIQELIEMLERKDLIINREYQRGSGLWPTGARSYFIDTILEEYPFPKLYIFEFFDRSQDRIKRELVDGQQRLLTILDFVNDKFSLSGETPYAGLHFGDLDQERREKFLSYSVSVDVIRNARMDEILQMFRRMNAFTLPLNEAEKRHSTFHGKFKWFINDACDNLNAFFVEYKVFTNRQIVRMADAELITDCVLSLERGILNSTPSELRSIYKKYDSEFDKAEVYGSHIRSTFEYIAGNFSELRGTYMMKPYALHSLVSAMMHARYEITTLTDQTKIPTIGRFCEDAAEASAHLLALAEAHEAKDEDGEYSSYVWGCLAGTNRAARRLARLLAIFNALGYQNMAEIRHGLAE